MSKKLLKICLRHCVPNVGTLLAVILLLSVYRVGAAPQIVASTTTTSTTSDLFSFQGMLANALGAPVNSKVNITFRLYAAPTGGTALWTEAHTGTNGVPVSDGLFHVLLGSLTPIPSEVWGRDSLYLGVQVGSDSEMTPREQVSAVPFSASSGFEGRSHSYPYVLHLSHFGLWQGSYCWGYVPGDPGLSQDYPDQPQCNLQPGLDMFAQGLNILAHSGSGHISAANNFPFVSVDLSAQQVTYARKWGYAYTFFLHNSGSARSFELPLNTCNDVAIYVTTGGVAINHLGGTASLVYHRFPGNSNDNLFCDCAEIDLTLQFPAGDFRVTLLTRGDSCTSYLRVGDFDAQGNLVGNWIEDAGLTMDWSGLRTYLGEY